MRKLPRVWQGLRLRIILIGYAVADDANIVKVLSSGERLGKRLAVYLSRGLWPNKPGSGRP